MVDQDGVPVTDATYKGKFTLLVAASLNNILLWKFAYFSVCVCVFFQYFGFSHCPDICPSELVKVGKVMTELGI